MNSRSLFMLLLRVSPRNMLLAIVAVSAGLTWYIYTEIAARTPEPVQIASTPLKQKTTVYVCTRDLSEGSTLCEEDLATQVVDIERAPIDAITDMHAALGRKLKYPVGTGALISTRDLAPIGGTQGFQSKLRAGERAVTFAVDNTTGVAGFIAPDSHVDVMVQVGAGADSATRAILSDVRVVASGTTYQKLPGQAEAQPYSTVTVAVLPPTAAKLINAMAAGKLYLTLRSDADHTPIAVSDLNSLFRHPKEQPTTLAQMPLLPPEPPIIRVEQPEEGIRNPLHEVEQYAGTNRNVTPVRQL